MSKTKTEIIRRLRLGNLRTLLRARCGPTLPDDDAGREYLWELLLCISLGAEPEPEHKMANTVETFAEWMGATEARQLIEQIARMPIHLRKRTARQLGDRLRVSNRERERLKLWTIAPFDMTDKQLKEQRKAKDRARKRRLSRAVGRKPQERSLSRQKPWESAGVSRRTWFRKRAKRRETSPRQEQNGRGTTLSAVKLLNYRGQTSATEKPERPKEASHGSGGDKARIHRQR
ncbi:MAG: hypothetical protein WAV38_03605 [Xanthobacteraceae bacterium]